MKFALLADNMHFLKELAELHQEEWGHLDRSFTLERRTKALKDAANEEGIPAIYIAYEEKELIGSAGIVQHYMKDYHPELSPWLAAVFVKIKWRRKGIASLLVKYCEEKAVKENIKKLYLYTEFAENLYSKIGWNISEKCKYKGVQVSVMYKELNS